MAAIASAGIDKYTAMDTTKLDSHANMIVLGKQALVIQYTGHSAEVNAFSDDAGGLSKVPIVDAVVAYDCPYTSKTYMLVMRNALHIPSMKHNLIPPFILRESGLILQDIPNIHCDKPTVEDHLIYDYVTKLRITLKLDGIFSYFPTRALTLQEMENCDQIEYVFLSPDAETWDPYTQTYALNEESLVDDGGEIVYPPPKDRNVHDPMEVGELYATQDNDNILNDNKTYNMFGILKEAVVNAYDNIVDAIIYSSEVVLDLPPSVERSVVSDPIRAQVASIRSVLDPELFINRSNERAAQSKFAAAVGSTNSNPQECDMFSANPQDSDPNDNNFKSLHPLEYLVDCELFEDIQK